MSSLDTVSFLDGHAETKSSPPSSVHKSRSPIRRAALALSIIGILLILSTFLISFTLSSRNLETTTKTSTHAHHQLPTNLSGIFPRAFPVWNKSLPCHSQYRAGSFVDEGLFMVKPSKTGGSTAASIHLRLAATLAKDKGWNLCQARFNHGSAVSYRYGQRNKKKSFLWTILRDPTARFISEFFFFQVSRQGVEPTDKAFREFIQHGGRGKFTHYFDILSTTIYNSSTDPVAAANAIIQEYDFIGVTERMDESAVALQMILGLSTASVLYISSKVNGGYDDGLYNQKCYFIHKSFVSPFMKQYFESVEWKDKNKWSNALHQAANCSLDMTIDALGREKFQEQLEKFRKAQAIVTSQCADSTLLPCSATGERREHSETNCLFYDMGCNFECLDRVSNETNLW